MTWDELVQEVYTYTKRDDLVGETNLAVRNAVRAAHKSGKYWRDLMSITIPGLSVDDAVQEINLATAAPGFRQVAILSSSDAPDKHFDPVTIDDLLSSDGYNVPRTNVYWGFGSNLRIRAAAPTSDYLLQYYRYPTVTPVTSFSSWIAEEHTELITLWAAMTVLHIVGEQEIRSRLEQLAAVALRDLQQDNLEIQGR